MAVNGSNYFDWTPNASEVPADEANPVLLITGAEIGTGHGFWTNVASDGSDIRVTLDDGTTEQPFHVIHIDTAAEELFLRFRSTITLTASAPETFRVYYNSADTAYAVTDTFGRNNVYQDYEAWWGLDQDPTGTAPQMIDYTGNGYDATANGNPTAQAGVVDQEISFDGDGDFFDFSPTIVVDGNMSIRAWVNFGSRSTHVGEVGSNNNYFRIDETGSWAMTDDSGFAADTEWTISASPDTDYLITIASNTSDEWSAFRSGLAASDNPQTQSAEFHMNGMGRGRGDGGSDMDGTLDEVAVANFTYDINRNTLESNNEGSPATFATAGAEQSASTATTLVFDQGSYSVTGQAIGLVQADVFPFNQGSYSVTGQDIGLVQVQVLEFEQGSYTITDSEVDTVTTDILEFAQGSYTVTGNDINLILTKIMEFGQGAYVVTGNDIMFDLLSRTTMSFGSGNYSVTGSDIDFVQRDILAFEQGSYSINGQDINLVERRIFQFEQGEYVITGYDISIRIEDSPEILILVSEITTDLKLDSTITTELELDSEI